LVPFPSITTITLVLITTALGPKYSRSRTLKGPIAVRASRGNGGPAARAPDVTRTSSMDRDIDSVKQRRVESMAPAVAVVSVILHFPEPLPAAWPHGHRNFLATSTLSFHVSQERIIQPMSSPNPTQVQSSQVPSRALTVVRSAMFDEAELRQWIQQRGTFVDAHDTRGSIQMVRRSS
jgi:hypothetical protein